MSTVEEARQRYLEALAVIEQQRSFVADYRQPAPDSARWPDFLVIGAQKAGTTWLHQMLSDHPEVWLPPIKELNYFNQRYFPSSARWEEAGREEQLKEAEAYYRSLTTMDLVTRSRCNAISAIREGPISDKWYSRVFGFAGVDMVCGEVCPDYGMLPRQAIAGIYRNNPAMKVAFIVRDPLDRTWSHIRMSMKPEFGGITIEGALSAEWPAFFARSNYPAIIRRWRAALPSEHFLLLDYEAISSQPDELMKSVCSTLGISFDARFFWRLNETAFAGDAVELSPEIIEDLLIKLRPIYEEMAVLAPSIGQPWVENRYGRRMS